MIRIPIGSPYAIPSDLVEKGMFMAIFRARDKSWKAGSASISGLYSIQIELRNKNVKIFGEKFCDFVEDMKTKTIGFKF